MRLGKVTIDVGYVVDLEDPDMVAHAVDSLYEDVLDAVKYNELGNWIHIGDYDSTLSEADIPSFLIEEKKLREEIKNDTPGMD